MQWKAAVSNVCTVEMYKRFGRAGILLGMYVCTPYYLSRELETEVTALSTCMYTQYIDTYIQYILCKGRSLSCAIFDTSKLLTRYCTCMYHRHILYYCGS